jgi:hypothetical protein
MEYNGGDKRRLSVRRLIDYSRNAVQFVRGRYFIYLSGIALLLFTLMATGGC